MGYTGCIDRFFLEEFFMSLATIRSKAVGIAAASLFSLFLVSGIAFADDAEVAAEVQDDVAEAVETAQQIEAEANSLTADSSETEVLSLARSLSATDSSLTSLTSSLSRADSLKLEFAKLQLETAASSKQDAIARIDQIAALQEQLKTCSEFLQEARLAKEQAKANDIVVAMSDDLVVYCIQNDLAYDKTGGDTICNADEWDVAIRSLEEHMDDLAMQMQAQTLQVQDSISAYSSYLQDASGSINDAGQTLTSVARGQTMLGEEGSAGMLVTGVLAGVVLGVVGTVCVQRVRAKKQQV